MSPKTVKRGKKFDPKVTTFAEVTTKLRQIGKYLGNVNAALTTLWWEALPKDPHRKGGGGGEGAGSKPPKGWPP